MASSRGIRRVEGETVDKPAAVDDLRTDHVRFTDDGEDVEYLVVDQGGHDGPFAGLGQPV